MYEDIIAMFCPSCLNKKVNSQHTVEDYIRKAIQAGEKNNVAGGYFILQGALATLQEEGGCPRCIDLIQRTSNMLVQT